MKNSTKFLGSICAENDNQLLASKQSGDVQFSNKNGANCMPKVSSRSKMGLITLILFLLSASLQTFSQNLLLNGNFDSSTTSWSSSPIGGILTFSGQYAYSGNTLSLNNSDVKSNYFVWQNVSASAGAKYNISFIASTHNPSYYASVGYEFYNSWGIIIGSRVEKRVTGSVFNSSGYSQYDFLNVTAPAGTAKLRVVGFTNGTALKLDNISVTAVPTCSNLTSGGTIGSSQTGCGSFDPAAFTSVTAPSGGSGALEVIWMKSTTSNVLTNATAAQWTVIQGANALTYDSGPITQTTYFTRCSRRAGCSDYVGEANVITVTVKASCCDNVTAGGKIGNDQTGCSGVDPTPFVSISDPSGGTGALEIVWLKSTTSSVLTTTTQSQWTPITGATGLTYDSGPLTQTTYFIRCSRRAGCTDYVGEANVIKVTVNTNCVGKDPVCLSRKSPVQNSTLCGDATKPYSLWFSDLKGNVACPSQYFTVKSGELTEYCDGTAVLNIVACVTGGGANDCITGTINYSGRTGTPPAGSPLSNTHCTGYSPNVGDWYYYPTSNGTFSGSGIYAGLAGTYTQNMAAFQVGTGGSLNDVSKFGASSWFKINITNGGSNNWSTASKDGDININLGSSTNIASVTATANPAAICKGSNVVLTATVDAVSKSANCSPTYSWVGSNGFTSTQASVTNTSVQGATTYTVTVTFTAVNGSKCSVTATTTVALSANCCDNVTNGGQIGSNQKSCGPFDPAPFTNVTLPSGGSGVLEYIWLKSTTASTFTPANASEWIPIVGSNSATLDLNNLSQTSYFQRCSRRVGCTDYVGETNVVAVIIDPIPAAPTVTPASICGTGTVTLGATCTTGVATWYAGVTGVSSISTGASLTTPSLTATTTYYVSCKSSAGCESGRTSVIATVNSGLSSPTVTPASICGTGTVTLGATCTTGVATWYAGATGGSSISTGASLTTPSLTATTTYYVSCKSSAGCESGRIEVKATVVAKITDGGKIQSDESICTGSTPSKITSVVPASGGDAGVAIEYLWLQTTSLSNGVCPLNIVGQTLYTAIPNTNTADYQPGAITQTTCYLRCARRAGCTDYIGGESNTVKKTVESNAIAPTVTPASICGTGTVTLGATCTTGVATWYAGVTGGSSISTGASLTTPSLTTTTTYYVSCKSSAGCESGRTSVIATVNSGLSVPVAIKNGTICGTGTVELGAICTTGVATWYVATTGGASIATGAAFITPVLTTTTSYYVSCKSSAGCESGRIEVKATVVAKITDGGKIQSDESICVGKTPSNITSVTPASGGDASAAIEYLWLQTTSLSNGVCPLNIVGQTLYTAIPNTNTADYQPGAITQTTCYLRCARRAGCTDYIGGESNTVKKTVLANCQGKDPVCLSRKTPVLNTSLCGDITQSYGLYFADLKGNVTSPNQHFSVKSGELTEFCDGTAVLNYTACVTGGGSSDCINVIVNYSGRTATPPTGSPVANTHCTSYSPNIGDWYYYPTSNGTFSGSGIYAGLTGTYTQNMAAFQIGTGGSLNDIAKLGASSWFKINITNGGTNNWSSVSKDGDININLGTSTTIASVTATATPTTICSGGDVNLSATLDANSKSVNCSPSYSWVGSNGFTSTQATVTNTNVTSSTTYTVTVTFTAVNGSKCSVTATTGVTITAIPAAPTVTPASICGTGTVTLGATCTTGVATWYAGVTGVSSISTGASLTTPSLTTTTTYYVSCKSSAGCESGRTSVIATVNSGLSAPTVTPASICGTGTVTLGATCTTGVATWYAGATGGSSISTGASLTTPSLTATTTYYVSCKSSAGCESGRIEVKATVVAKITDGGKIQSDESICTGSTPSKITSVVPASGGDAGVAIEYLWLQTTSLSNGVCPLNIVGQTLYTAIPNTNTADYQPGAITQTTCYLRCARRAGCTDYIGGESNTVKKTVTSSFVVTPSTNPNAVCSGTAVSITLTTTAAGAVTYSWSGPNGFTATSQNVTITNATIANSGVYTVSASNGGGCSAIATVQVKVVNCLKIGDLVFNDKNNSGKQDIGELGVSGVTVKLFDSANLLVATTTTDANGLYLFSNLPIGNYVVEITAPAGYKSSTGTVGSATGSAEPANSPANNVDGYDNGTTVSGQIIRSKPVVLTVSSGDILAVDFGLFKPAQIGDFVFRDLNGDGKQDAGENGVAGVTVKLYDSANNVIATTTTDANGKYLFDNLIAGNYTVEFVKSTIGSGFSFSPQGATTPDKDSDADITTGKTSTITLTEGQINKDIDAGVTMPCDTDKTPPVLSACPADILIKTRGTLAIVGWVAPTATDNCGTPVITSTSESGSQFPVGTTTVTYTATDAKGNKTSCSFIVNVVKIITCDVDTQAPVFYDCPTDINLLVKTGTPAIANWDHPSVGDNCGIPSVTYNFEPGQEFPAGVTEVVYTAKDAKGNTSYCRFKITVNYYMVLKTTPSVIPAASSRVAAAEEVALGDDVTIYPNPSVSDCAIELSAELMKTNKSVEVSVLNMSGNIQFTQTATGTERVSVKVPVQDMPSGTYFVNVGLENGRMIIKKLQIVK